MVAATRSTSKEAVPGPISLPSVPPLPTPSVQSAPARLVFHSPEWARAVRDCYGFEDLGGELPQGCLPLFHTRSPLLGSKLVSAVFNTYASPACATPGDCEELVARAVALAEERRVAFLEIKGQEELPEHVVRRFDLQCRRYFQRSVVALGSGDPELRYERKFRKHLRRSRKALSTLGVRIDRSIDPRDLHAFHDLLVRCQRDRHAMIVQPVALFEALHRSFLARDRGHLFVARSTTGELVGGLLFLTHAETATGCFGAVREDHRPLSLDAVMKAESIRFYRERGFLEYDLGLSSPQQRGLLFAKACFGARTTTLPYYYRLVRARRMPTLDFNDAYPWLRRAFRRTPLPIVRQLSSWLPRYLN